MNWSPKPIPDEDKVKQLQKQIGVPFEIACIMIQRVSKIMIPPNPFLDQSFQTCTIRF